MEEYYSKSEIDKAIARWIMSGESRGKDAASRLKQFISDVPYENVRKVTFCKNCRYRGGKYGEDECKLVTRDKDHHVSWIRTKPYGFCNYGKPRNGE